MNKLVTPAGRRGLATMLLLASPLLYGCGQIRTDPYEREGIWRPSGVNAANLAMTLANPGDLVRGRDDPAPGVRMGTGAVERLWKGPAAGGTPLRLPASPEPPAPGPR